MALLLRHKLLNLIRFILFFFISSQVNLISVFMWYKSHSIRGRLKTVAIIVKKNFFYPHVTCFMQLLQLLPIWNRNCQKYSLLRYKVETRSIFSQVSLVSIIKLSRHLKLLLHVVYVEGSGFIYKENMGFQYLFSFEY